MKPILRFENVNKRYPNGVHALRDVSFDVRPGEFVSIIGPSGSGKSTLLRAVNQLIHITGGQIWLDGDDVAAMRGRRLRALRRKVGMVFQHHNLVHRLSVLQNTLHGRLGHLKGIHALLGLYSEEDKRRNIALLEELGIGHYCYHRAGELSGGQRQRVGIARAIMQDPKILLCDEPIASLDPSSAKNIMDILRSLALGNNLACIVNLHQLDVAIRYSTRIIGLSRGKIIFDDEPGNLTPRVIESIYGTAPENMAMREPAYA